MIPIPEAGFYQEAQGIEDARAVPGIEDVVITAKEFQKLVPLPEGSSYLGFTFARGASGMVLVRTVDMLEYRFPDACAACHRQQTGGEGLQRWPKSAGS
jgi:hypothetical protein